MKQVELHHGARTDVGRVREVNEDAYLAAPPVFVVADGLGGHGGGDVASGLVVEEFGRLAEGFDPARGSDQVGRALDACQRRVAEYGAQQRAAGEPGGHAGTTVVAAVVVHESEPEWLLVNVGDSRIYRLHEGRLDQVSVDHSLVQELVDAGTITAEEATRHPERNVVTRALGSPGRVSADYFRLPLAAAERLLLCSDGITGMIGDGAIAAVLVEAEDPRDAADRLVEAALEAGGEDNATAVVIDVVGWVDPTDYDSDRQRSSLEQKLGALP